MSSTKQDPGRGGKICTPSDTVPINARSLYVGASGSISVKFPGNDTAVLFENVPEGILPIECEFVMATGTTATAIVAIF